MYLYNKTKKNLVYLFKLDWLRKKIILELIFKQILFTAIEAIPLITYTAALLGFIAIAQGMVFLPQFGGMDYISKIMVFLIREICPLILMFIIIGRSGNAISVEIANMKLNKEIDYIEDILNIDSDLFLLFPRVLGVTISIFSLSIIFNLVTIIIGYLSAIIFVYFPFNIFIQQILQSLTLVDIITWILKVNIFGIIISITSYHEGISISLTPRDIPRVTTRCFIKTMSTCLIVDAVISAIVIGVI